MLTSPFRPSLPPTPRSLATILVPRLQSYTYNLQDNLNTLTSLNIDPYVQFSDDGKVREGGGGFYVARPSLASVAAAVAAAA